MNSQIICDINSSSKIVARYISVHPKRDTCVFEFLAKLWANLELKMLQVFSEPEKVGHHLRI